MIPNRFEGQTALVTGGAKGLGKAIARRLAIEGARVTIADVSEDTMADTRTEFANSGIGRSTFVTDIGDEAQVEQVIGGIVNEHGNLDVVVNAAGIVGPSGVKTSELDAGGFDQAIRVNLRGSFLVCKHALRAMAPNNYGRILLIASIAGKEGNAGMTAYSSSKAGVIGLVKSAGKEFAGSGITVNGIAPAVIRTALLEQMDPQQIKYMTDKIPMNRCGTLEEFAELASWIVSPSASFNTGFTFDLSGGRAVY